MLLSPKANSSKTIAREKALIELRTKILVAGLICQECTPYHFKCGALNFYPTSGKIHRDGDPQSYRARGIDAFIRACLKEADGTICDPDDDEIEL